MQNTRLYIILILFWITAGIVGLIWFEPQWGWIAVAWIFYALGNGTVGHRYFAHGSFAVSQPVHWILAMWCTVCAYAPLHYWKVQHLHHHRNADNEQDLHAPRNGIWRAFLLWPFSINRLEAVFRERNSLVILARALRDPVVARFSSDFFLINLIFIIGLAIYDLSVIFEIFGVAYVIEQLRLGLINTVTHLSNMPGNYINHQHTGSDNSQNNWILGLITLGFAWHNNHHANPKQLILTERWWEIDIEGYVGWLLSLTSKLGRK